MALIFPPFGPHAGVTDTVSVEHDGFKLVASIHEDTQTGAPWKEHAGHGPVSEWTSRPKRAGERVLAGPDCLSNHRFYDFAGAVEIAKRDKWGPLIPYRTPGIARLAAVEADFRAMKAWADDEWFWCGIVVRVYKADVCLTSPGASLWGIECNYPNSDNSYLSEVASDLSEEALEMARAKLKELCECPSN